MKLDLSKFKKIRSDKHSTLMRHEDGHFIRVAHRALHPDMAKELHSIPEHPKASKSKSPDIAKPKAVPPSVEEAALPIDKKALKMFGGGRVVEKPKQKAAQAGQWPVAKMDPEKGAAAAGSMKKSFGGYAHGGAVRHYFAGTPSAPVPPQDEETVSIDPTKVQMPPESAINPAPGAQAISQANPVKPLDQGTEKYIAEAEKAGIEPEQALQLRDQMSKSKPSALDKMLQSGQIDQTAYAQMKAAAGSAMPFKQDAAMAPAPMAPSREPLAQLEQSVNQANVGTEALKQGARNVEKGILGQASAQSELGKRSADIREKALENEVAITSDFMRRKAELQEKIDSVTKAYNEGEIKPDNYWANKTTGDKIRSFIGLALGGFASGWTKGPNLAAEAIDRAIQNDIEAQKANLGKKHSLLQTYLQQMGNLQDAEHMTKLTFQNQALQKLQIEADKLQDPTAKATAQQAIGTLQIQLSNQMAQLPQKQAIVQAVKEGRAKPEALISMLPEHAQKAAREEVSSLQSISQTMQNVAAAFKEVATVGGISGSIPFTQDRAKITANRALILNIIRAGMKGQGAISDQEMETSIMPNLPDATDTQTMLNQKLQKLMTTISAKRAGAAPTLNQFNIPTEIFESSKPKVEHLPPVL